MPSSVVIIYCHSSVHTTDIPSLTAGNGNWVSAAKQITLEKATRIHKATHHGNVEAEVTNCPSNRPIPLKSSYKTFTTVNVK